MRGLLLVVTGIFLSCLWGPAEHLRGIVHQHVLGVDARQCSNAAGKAVRTRPPGHFPPEMMQIFFQLEPRNSPGFTYHMPDSSNTKMEWLSYWPNENAIILETMAGYEKGSGGADIIAAVYDSTKGEWKSIFYDLGELDSVYDSSHNGLYDFTYNYKWEEPMRMEFNGTTFAESPLHDIVSDTQLIAAVMAKPLGYGDYLDFVYMREDIFPGSNNDPYIVTTEGAYGKFIIHEETKGNYRLVNYFENGVQVDVLSKKHNNMSDIKVTNWDMTYSVYCWNGNKYILHSTGKWACPA